MSDPAPVAPATYFDAYARDYRESVERSVRFTGRGLDFFQRRKVDLIRALGSRHLGSMKDASVLDVGCGTGVTAELLRPHVASVIGVDVAHEMIDQARRRDGSCAYEVYDGERLPFEGCSFDLVLTICVLHHVPPAQWQSFTDEMVRVTRPGGLVVIVEHNRLNPLTRRAVSVCPFDRDAVLVPHRTACGLLDRSGAGPAKAHHFLFSPFDGAVVSALERGLSALPLGGQYAAVARRRICQPTSSVDTRGVVACGLARSTARTGSSGAMSYVQPGER